MLSDFLRWLFRPAERPRRGPRSRFGGCLLWVLGLIIVLVILMLMFGGFQKGTKVTGMGAAPPFSVTAAR
jgi:hypothetical protein